MATKPQHPLKKAANRKRTIYVGTQWNFWWEWLGLMILKVSSKLNSSMNLWHNWLFTKSMPFNNEMPHFLSLRFCYRTLKKKWFAKEHYSLHWVLKRLSRNKLFLIKKPEKLCSSVIWNRRGETLWHLQPPPTHMLSLLQQRTDHLHFMTASTTSRIFTSRCLSRKNSKAHFKWRKTKEACCLWCVHVRQGTTPTATACAVNSLHLADGTLIWFCSSARTSGCSGQWQC